jgi:hypothetical protein
MILLLCPLAYVPLSMGQKWQVWLRAFTDEQVRGSSRSPFRDSRTCWRTDSSLPSLLASGASLADCLLKHHVPENASNQARVEPGASARSNPVSNIFEPS